MTFELFYDWLKWFDRRMRSTDRSSYLNASLWQCRYSCVKELEALFPTTKHKSTYLTYRWVNYKGLRTYNTDAPFYHVRWRRKSTKLLIYGMHYDSQNLHGTKFHRRLSKIVIDMLTLSTNRSKYATPKTAFSSVFDNFHLWTTKHKLVPRNIWTLTRMRKQEQLTDDDIPQFVEEEVGQDNWEEDENNMKNNQPLVFHPTLIN